MGVALVLAFIYAIYMLVKVQMVCAMQRIEDPRYGLNSRENTHINQTYIIHI
jgi:hypothetical protein